MAIHYQNMSQTYFFTKAGHFCLNRRGNRHVITDYPLNLIPFCGIAVFNLTLVFLSLERSDVTAFALKATPIKAKLEEWELHAVVQ